MNYHISRNGQQSAGLTEQDIRDHLGSGQLGPDDLCWTDGMSEWKPIGTMFSAPSASPAYAQAGSSASVAEMNPYAPPRAELARPRARTRDPLASLGQRFGAAMLDILVVFVVCMPFMFGMEMTESEAEGELSSTSYAVLSVGGVLLAGLVIYNLILLGTKGQTIGKKMLGIRIANYLDDGNPGFIKAFLLRSVVNGIIGVIPLYGLVDLCFIFGEDRRCIHDLLAGTRVVQC